MTANLSDIAFEVPDRYNKPYQGSTSGVWVLDLETDGFWFAGSKIHCTCAIDPIEGCYIAFRRVPKYNDLGEEDGFLIDQTQESLEFFSKQKVLIAHNGIDFDFPFMLKMMPTWKSPPVFDTMTLASMLDSNRKTQSLDSWGKTLCNHKMDYGKTADWSKYDDNMYIYCMQDVVVTADLYLTLCLGSEAVYDRYGIRCMQVLDGAGFDPANPPTFIF